MYLIVIAWIYVVLMMSVAEATNSNGTVLGAVITFPHKTAAFAHLDEACEAARFTGACNVIRRESDSRWSVGRSSVVV